MAQAYALRNIRPEHREYSAHLLRLERDNNNNWVVTVYERSIMRLHKSAWGIVESACKTALESSVNAEDDHEFRDFVESVSVSTEELAALVGMPELSSIHEVRQYLQQRKRSGHPIDPSSSEVGGSRVESPDPTSVTADHADTVPLCRMPYLGRVSL
jgi:hypothetical protein